MTPGVVEFDYDSWAVRYRQIASGIAKNVAQVYFNEAQLYLDNTPSSPVCDLLERSTLLNMLTTHLIVMNEAIGGVTPSPLVGQIVSAKEGSVSVDVKNDYPPGTAQWYQQTKYGAQFWAATAQYRQFIYAAPEPYVFDPWAYH